MRLHGQTKTKQGSSSPIQVDALDLAPQFRGAFPLRKLLKLKGHTVWSVDADATVFEALTLMADKEIGALAVLENGQLVGMFSERDYARKVILLGRSSRVLTVREAMAPVTAVASPDQTVAYAMSLMTNKYVRHLPVFEDGELIGLVSIGDLVKSIITQQDFIINMLEQFITGTYPA